MISKIQKIIFRTIYFVLNQSIFDKHLYLWIVIKKKIIIYKFESHSKSHFYFELFFHKMNKLTS